jgi:hypothetical protein
MTTPPGWYGALHIAQWSASLASGKVTGCRHQVSARAMFPRRLPWSSLLAGWKNTTHNYVLASNHRTFLRANLNHFVTWNGRSIQLIKATSFLEKWIESVVADKLSYFLCLQIFEHKKIGKDINFQQSLKIKVGHIWPSSS